jgi:cytoskeletal protein RodZ
VSIPFESGIRQRPVDVSVDDSDDLPIDGTRLKQERIERGLSVNDAARMATLSREQIEQIENGGLRAFYGARHKRLAARKYADIFGIELAELLPAGALAPETHGEHAEVDPGPVSTQAPSIIEHNRGVLAQPVRSNFESRRLPLLVVIIVALVLTFSILRGLTPNTKPATEPVPEPVVESVPAEPSPETTEPSVAAASPAAASPAAAAPATAAPATAAPAVPTPEATAATTANNVKPEIDPDPCAVTAGGEIARWAPAQVRATYTKLYLGSFTESTLCVIDATGAAKPLKMKAGATTSLSGKPPYTIHSQQLPKLQIFLQGLKVKVPPGTVSIQLFTTQSLLPKESEQPAQENAQ